MSCTIATGIMGCDGIIRGRLSDLEVFSAFSIDFEKDNAKLDPLAHGEFSLYSLTRLVGQKPWNMAKVDVEPRKSIDELTAFYAAQEASGTEESPWAEPPEVEGVDDFAPARLLFGESE